MDEAPSWFKEHEEEDRKAFADRPTKDEMKQIVHDALIDFFSTKGVLTKNIIITSAIIIGSIAVIAGAGKWLLGLIGFTYIK